MMRLTLHVIIAVELTSEEVLVEYKRGYTFAMIIFLVLNIVKRRLQTRVTRVCIECEMIMS